MLGLRFKGLGFRILGLEFRVQGFGFMVYIGFEGSLESWAYEAGIGFCSVAIVVCKGLPRPSQVAKPSLTLHHQLSKHQTCTLEEQGTHYGYLGFRA